MRERRRAVDGEGEVVEIAVPPVLAGLVRLDDQVALNFAQERLIARLTAIFGILALVLASVGLYGITAYQVACRTSEIGLRAPGSADI